MFLYRIARQLGLPSSLSSHCSQVRSITSNAAAIQIEPSLSRCFATTSDSITSNSILSSTNLKKMKEDGRPYAVVEIANRPLLVTKNDVLVLDRLPSVQLGDVLELNKVREIGTLNHTIRGAPYVSENLFKIQATILENPRGEKQAIIKKKRRKNYQRKLGHRQELTVLRIQEIHLNI